MQVRSIINDSLVNPSWIYPKNLVINTDRIDIKKWWIWWTWIKFNLETLFGNMFQIHHFSCSEAHRHKRVKKYVEVQFVVYLRISQSFRNLVQIWYFSMKSVYMQVNITWLENWLHFVEIKMTMAPLTLFEQIPAPF